MASKNIDGQKPLPFELLANLDIAYIQYPGGMALATSTHSLAHFMYMCTYDLLKLNARQCSEHPCHDVYIFVSLARSGSAGRSTTLPSCVA